MKVDINTAICIVVALALASNSSAQFRQIPFASGVAHVSSEVVRGSYSRIGGGVVLRGVASCGVSKEDCEITSASINSASSTANLVVTSNRCSVKYSAPSWVLKDAVELVSSETNNIIRNVNLLGEPTEVEMENPDIGSFYRVEVSKSLIGRKAGEVLLAVDIMLTNPDFYSQFDINRTSDPIGYSSPHSTSNNHVALLQQKFHDAPVANWTWNDENTKFTYYINCQKKTLVLSGEPIYTFLDDEGEVIENLTTYFMLNKKLIYNVNPQVYSAAIRFSEVSAFFRHLKNGNPTIWTSVASSAEKLPKSYGTTPRLISRD